MADEELVSLDGVVGGALNEAQVRGIIAQIDLDIMNLLRDGKLAAMKYDVGGNGPSGDRGSNLKALIEARGHYERLLEGMGCWVVTSSHES
jgi:hypothetical protein